ncbi:MAG TPA: hypothetical protein VIJ34_11360, partial [Acidimicrobiales bacterium]
RRLYVLLRIARVGIIAGIATRNMRGTLGCRRRPDPHIGHSFNTSHLEACAARDRDLDGPISVSF